MGPSWGWGANYAGQATPPVGLNDVVASRAMDITVWLCDQMAPSSRGDRTPRGRRNTPADLSGVVAVAAGDEFSLALKSDGTVVDWGSNRAGGATPPPGLNDVVAIAARGLNAAALRSDGTVVQWGWRWYNELAIPPGLSNVIAIDVSLALKSDGTVKSWGYVGAPPTDLASVVAVARGTGHMLALRNDGTVVAWGRISLAKRPSPPVFRPSWASRPVETPASLCSADRRLRASPCS